MSETKFHTHIYKSVTNIKLLNKIFKAKNLMREHTKEATEQWHSWEVVLGSDFSAETGNF
jgi:hypothetical protein